MSFQNLIETILSSQPEESLSKLTRTTKDITLLPYGAKEVCTPFYNSTMLEVKILASILNAIFTERKATFLLSKRILDSLVKQDGNLERNSLDSQSFSKFISWLSDKNIIREVKPSTKDKAAVYELSSPDLIDAFDRLVGQDYRAAQKTRCIKVYEAEQVSEQVAGTDKSVSQDVEVDLDDDSATEPTPMQPKEPKTFFKGELDRGLPYLSKEWHVRERDSVM